MRQQSAHLWRYIGRLTLMTALLCIGMGAARAQLPVFDGIDWATDRGNITDVVVTGNPAGVNPDAFRPGYTPLYQQTAPAGGPPDINSLLNNNPGLGVRRWVFPRTSDLTPTTASGANTVVTVDNATRSGLGLLYASPPAPFTDDPNEPIGDDSQDILGNRVRVSPFPLPPAVQLQYDPQQMAHMVYIPNGGLNWILPDSIPGDPGIAAGGVSPDPDYRSPIGGFSLDSDPSLPWDLDYAFTPAVHNDFDVPDGNGGTTPATDAQIAQLPYGDQPVVAAINTTLINTAQVKAYWTSGGYNMAAGNYAVQMFEPGDGTITADGVVHPSTSRVFVRVSWGTSTTIPGTNTVNADGTLNFATINNLTNSRIFVLNQEGGGGWVTLAAPAQVQAGIPYDGTAADQIVVILYTLTPDDTNPNSSDNTYTATPLVTADAVQFQPIITASTTSPGLGAISPNGRILAPAVATNKLTNAINSNISPTEKLPFFYFGREETISDTTDLVPENPNEPVDLNPSDPGYNPLVPDPTATKTVPVFYCLDNQNGNSLNGGVQITSIDKVRWRYVGLPDSNDLLVDGSDTTLASPLLSNVRCRDGVVRPMVFFVTTSPDTTLGRVYAFDPVGDRTTLTTTAYWTYPSYRPIDAADAPNNTDNQLTGVYYEYHDPNYKNWAVTGGVNYFNATGGVFWNPGDYPTTSFGAKAIADQKIGADEYYDGEITTNPGQANSYIIDANNTQLASFAGVFASPLLIDDPANPAGPQLLIVPNTNGRLYALDAGGRGDFAPNTAATPVPGTTQRLWTYPHFGADGYHFLGLSTRANTVNQLQDELGVGISLTNPPLGGFENTPAYDPNYVANNPLGDPLFVTATDGYLRAILPIRDSIGNPQVVGSQVPNWNDAARLLWTYPSFNSYPLTPTGDETTPSDISPVQIFTNAEGHKHILFTAVGRVYDMPEQSLSAVNTPNWIWPFTNNPPFASNPNDTLELDFAAMPPLAVSAANLPGATRDLVYALDSSSNLYQMTLASNGMGATNFLATGQSISGSYTISPPILSLLQAQTYYTTTGAIGTSQPALVFADTQGNAWGMGALPVTVNGVTSLPVIWSHSDSIVRRDAPFILSNGMLIEGGEDGQLRAYGVGTGVNQDQDTLGTGEPPERTPGINELSIDLRSLNLYTKDDWTNMMQGPTYTGKRETALADENGNNLTNTATAAQNNVNNTVFGADWGDYLYVVACGVYHAQPLGAVGTVFGTAAPRISVTFTVSAPDQPAVTYPASGALVLPGYVGGVAAGDDPNLPTTAIGWPDDMGVTTTEHNNLKIYGMDTDGNTRELIGPNDDVFPWIAKIRIPISPSNRIKFGPGVTGYKITASATITQDIDDNGQLLTPATANSYTLGLGQTYWQGYDVAPAIPGGPVPSPNASTLAAGRQVGITNPLGLTVRGFTGNGSNDMTGPNQRNIIGWAGSINFAPNSPGELLGNFNQQSVPGVVAGGGATINKGIFAPIQMISDGTGATYQALNPTRQQINPLYAVDRSALARMTGKSTQVQVVSGAPQWFGGPSSVMNPLPWEQLPTDLGGTKDYPGIGESNLTVTTGSGQDAIHTPVNLTPPIYHDQNPILNPNPDPDVIKTRLIVPSPFLMSVNVPKYQPANVNRGPITVQGALPNGNALTFGEGFTGIDGVRNNLVIGPMQTSTGTPVNMGDPLAFPSAGYTALLSFLEVIPGSASTSTGVAGGTAAGGLNRLSRIQAINSASVNATGGSRANPQRYFDIGLTVPPNIRMSVQETTVDLGKLPHGAGYSPFAGNFYSVPFSPTGSSDWPLNTVGNNLLSPWDDPNNPFYGQFFRPFTLQSDSNINLINIRAAKLTGLAGQPIGPTSHSVMPVPGAPTAVRLTSDQVNNISVAPLYGTAFAITPNGVGPSPNGLGNIGIVTSFDHQSLNSAANGANFLEHSLWPLANPYVYGQDVNAISAANGSLITTNSPGLGVMGWMDQVQPQPTITKPRVGDATGHVATIPDKPHDAPDIQVPVVDPTQQGGIRFTSLFTTPEISIGIPVGTPVGTYSAPVNFYEDNMPPQWREWLRSSAGFQGGADNDGILNLSAAGDPIEVYTNPTFTLKVTVRESRLTEGTTAGTLSEMDNVFNNQALQFIGANAMPAAWLAPGAIANGVDPRTMLLYWSTNRVPGGAAQPSVSQPWTLTYSAMPMPYALGVNPPFQGDANFAIQGNVSGNPQQTQLSIASSAAWWTNPLNDLFSESPNNYANLFPESQAEQAAATSGAFVPPFLAGQRVPQTAKMLSPAIASTLNLASHGYGSPADVTDPEAYLFWQGQIDKQSVVGLGGASAVRDTRTFFQPISTTGTPIGPTFSLQNDPALTKLSPKPLLVKLPAGGGAGAQKFLYLFWHANNNSSTAIYYNVASTTNLNAPFNPANATNGNIWAVDPATGQPVGDIKLPLPGSLVSESDPYPIYRHVYAGPTLGQVDAIDVVFTGVLSNRQKVEVLLARYMINRVGAPGVPVGSLTLIPLPTVVQETMSRVGTTNTFTSRDAFWGLGTGPNGTVQSTDTNGLILIQYQQNSVGGLYNLNEKYTQANGVITPAALLPTGLPAVQTGTFDPASGLLIYNSMAIDGNNNPQPTIFGGGQIIVDVRSGTVSFPQVAPTMKDTILVSYTPYVMRLNTSRDQTNIIPSSIPAAWINNPAFAPKPGVNSPGSNSVPVAIMDRTPNPRAILKAPAVIGPNFTPGVAPELDRLWVLYRKNDPSGSVKSTIYYKAMRLMVKLPRPFALTAPNANGQQQLAAAPTITSLVAGNLGPYEVDWVRGRIYFTEVDEGKPINVTYQTDTGGTFSGTYIVAWGDEMSAASTTGDETVPENPLPTDQAVSEGQVAAFKDPYLDKVWVFWSSTRANTQDLYFETIAPQLYPTASNQQ